MNTDQEPAYEVEPQEEGGYRVISPSGITVMSCGDSRSAEHYASLLEGAFRQGYKAGYRAARAAGGK